MKLVVILYMLCFLRPLADGDPDSPVSCHFRAASFDEFAGYIYSVSGVRIYYRAAWTGNVKVTIEADSIPVVVAVRKALEGTGLSVSAWNGDLVVIPGEGLPDRLPQYTSLALPAERQSADTGTLTRSEERYLTGRKADLLQVIRVGRKGVAAPGSRVTIRGYITEQQTGEAVIGATMFLEELKTGAAADQNGIVSMAVTPGTYTAVFAYMGMETRRCMLEIMSGGEFSLEMKKAAIQMKEVVVYGDRQMNMRLKDPGLEKISATTIKEIPMLMGERDILKVSELLPGIVTVGEGSAGLNVRGGNYDQNVYT